MEAELHPGSSGSRGLQAAERQGWTGMDQDGRDGPGWMGWTGMDRDGPGWMRWTGMH